MSVSTFEELKNDGVMGFVIAKIAIVIGLAAILTVGLMLNQSNTAEAPEPSDVSEVSTVS